LHIGIASRHLYIQENKGRSSNTTSSSLFLFHAAVAVSWQLHCRLKSDKPCQTEG